MDDQIIPDPEDFDVVDAMQKSRDATDSEKLRLAQEVKFMRLHGPPTGSAPNRYDKGHR